MEEIQKNIEAKEEELTAKEEELVQAKVEENNQYEDMKKRIKYMYENGNVQFIEILLESQTIADFPEQGRIYQYNFLNMTEICWMSFQAVVEDVEQPGSRDPERIRRDGRYAG